MHDGEKWGTERSRGNDRGREGAALRGPYDVSLPELLFLAPSRMEEEHAVGCGFRPETCSMIESRRSRPQKLQYFLLSLRVGFERVPTVSSRCLIRRRVSRTRLTNHDEGL